MSRVALVATCVSLFASVSAASPAAADSALATDDAPLVSGAQNSQPTNNGHNRRPARRAPARETFVVSPSSRFPGSYYVENGKHYYQPGQQGGQAEIIERGGFDHVWDLAERLEHEARTMCRDMADSYRDQPNYAPMYREAYRIWELAKQIESNRGEWDRGRVGAVVRDLDSRFQLLRREVSGWSNVQPIQRGEGTLQAKVERAEAVLQHMWNDVAPSQNTWVARRDIDAAQQEPPKVAHREIDAPLLQAPQNSSPTILR